MDAFTTAIPLGWDHTDAEHDALDIMKKEWEATLPNYSLMEWLEIFPMARSAAIRSCKRRIKNLKKGISSLSEYRETLYDGYVNTAPFKEQSWRIAWIDERVQKWNDTYETEIKRLEFEIRRIENIGKEVAPSGRGYSEEEFARAKSVSIASLIKVNRAKKALCVWHTDTNPSMHVYGTRVYCFACARGGDVIDVYRVLNGCDMVTAVKALSL